MKTLNTFLLYFLGSVFFSGPALAENAESAPGENVASGSVLEAVESQILQGVASPELALAVIEEVQRNPDLAPMLLHFLRPVGRRRIRWERNGPLDDPRVFARLVSMQGQGNEIVDILLQRVLGYNRAFWQSERESRNGEDRIATVKRWVDIAAIELPPEYGEVTNPTITQVLQSNWSHCARELEQIGFQP